MLYNMFFVSLCLESMFYGWLTKEIAAVAEVAGKPVCSFAINQDGRCQLYVLYVYEQGKERGIDTLANTDACII